jgi:hypothetical protein
MAATCCVSFVLTLAYFLQEPVVALRPQLKGVSYLQGPPEKGRRRVQNCRGLGSTVATVVNMLGMIREKKQSSVLSDQPLVNWLAVAISMKVVFGGDSLIKWSVKLGA